MATVSFASDIDKEYEKDPRREILANALTAKQAAPMTPLAGGLQGLHTLVAALLHRKMLGDYGERKAAYSKGLQGAFSSLGPDAGAKELAQALIASENPDVQAKGGDVWASSFTDKKPETWSTKPIQSADNKSYLFSNAGNRKEVEGFVAQPDKQQFLNVGNRIVPVDPRTGQPTGEGLEMGVSPSTVYSAEASAAQGNANRAQRASEGAANRSARMEAAKMGGQESQGALRREFNKLPAVKNYTSIVPIVQSAREATTTDTAAADMNLVYAAAKVMDPESVVRESETAMVVQAGSPAEQFKGTFNYLVGGGRLTPTTRKDLMNEIESRAKGHEELYKGAKKEYLTGAPAIGSLPELGAGRTKEEPPPVGSILKMETGPKAAPSVAPPAAMERLKADPSLASDFKAKYGYLPPGF